MVSKDVDCTNMAVFVQSTIFGNYDISMITKKYLHMNPKSVDNGTLFFGIE